MRVRGCSTSTVFTKDSTVEVTSDEEGFKGVWFEATVLRCPVSPKKNKVLVEYKSIVSEENGSELLKELVNVSFVRPVPPPVEKVEGFELYDVVDAFYKDGWWTGVVTRVLGESRYQVTFHNPPDELEFPHSDLRFHQQWVKGKWVRPGKQRTGSLMFSVEKKVEVSFDTVGCRGAWFPATVLEDCGNGSFVVEYYHPGCNDEAVAEKVTVDSLHIRPCPPQSNIKKFILEKVDAYYDFAWWSGVITRVLADSRYIVFSKHTNKQQELDESDLRPHMDWIDGKWSTASQDVLNPSDCQTNGSNNCNDSSILQKDVPLGRASTVNEIYEERTELSLKHLEDLDATPLTNEVSPKELLENALSNFDAASLQPLELAKEGTEAPKISPEDILQNALSNADALSLQPPELAKKETEAPKMSPEACKHRAKTSKTPRTPRTSQTPRRKNPVDYSRSRTSQTPRRRNPVDYSSPNSECAEVKISVPVAGEERSDTPFFQKRTRKRCQELDEEKTGTPEKLQVPNSTPKSTDKGSKSIAIENAADVTQKGSTRKETDVPVILGLECNKVMSSRTKRSRQVDNGSLEPIGGQKQIDAAIDSIQESEQLVDGDSNEKKKRGRPRKKLISTPSDTAQNGDRSKDESVGPDSVDLLEAHIARTGKRARTRKMSLIKMSNEKAVQSSTKQHEKHYIKKGKQQPRSATIESRAQGSADASRVKTSESIRILSDSEEVLAEVPYNGFDDQPLAKWFEEMQSPTSVDGLSSPKQCSEMRDKQDVPTQTPVNMNPTTQTETQSLPFVKNALLWATIESMDIFRRIPQKPHFRPLEHSKESSREGQAIGCMVTFSSIAEKISSLQHDDPRSIIEEILETLSDLENHGFDVHLLQNRLAELLLMKDKREKLEVQAADIDNQIIKHSTEGKNIDGEIEEIKKQIAELEDKLSLAISRKEVKDREIDALKSQLGDIQADMKNAHNGFAVLASKPL